jgi:hypothetical protein
MGKSRKPLTTHKLAHMLRVPGVSVSSRKIKGGAARGYVLDDFEDIFARYLPLMLRFPPFTPLQSVQAS